MSPFISQLLDAAAAGDRHAAAELLPLVYDELRKLAAARMAAEKPGQTLQATALVHEAYMRLIGSPSPPVASGGSSASGGSFANRGHFFAAAAESMRRILVEAARRKGRLKHGGKHQRVNLDNVPCLDPDDGADDLLALNDALDALQQEDPAKAELVKLRYFAGLTLEEAAESQGISLATAKRRWSVARAWLYDALSPEKD